MTEREPIEAVKNKAYWLIERIDAALEAGEIDESEWHRRISEFITHAYLSADTPWGQSGKSGDVRSWDYARSLVCDAIHKDGSFLDVGCANGFLMECVKRWAALRGRIVDPYGLDISVELADFARSRLPAWATRIHTGNVLTWQPPRKFDFVRTGLEYVPPRRRLELLQRLLEKFLVEDGRLIVGTYYGESHRPDLLGKGTLGLGIHSGWVYEPPSSRRSPRLPRAVDRQLISSHFGTSPAALAS